jgi:hypothetical protein
VPLVTDGAAYPSIAAKIGQTLRGHGFTVRPTDPPWWVTAPSRILRALGGPSFADYVPERLAYLSGPGLEVALYPTSLLLRGAEKDTIRSQGLLVEALSDAPAYQTFHPDAQDIERQVRSVWRALRRNPAAHEGSPWLEQRLQDIARDLQRLPVPYDDWHIAYRQVLQLGRALGGERQLLEQEGDDPNGTAHRPSSEEVTMAIDHRAAARVHTLSTRELLRAITDQATLLVRKEVELATTEIKADLTSQVAMAKGLGIASLAVILGLNLLLVSAVIALAPYITPWLGALILGGALVLAGAVVGYASWTRRLSNPLALTRKTLREDVQWAKEQLA